MRASPDAKRASLPLDYYARLQSARKYLEGEVEVEMVQSRSNTQNKRLLETISYLQGLNELTDEEQDYLVLLYQSISQSALAKKSIKSLADICKLSHPGPLALFNALRKAMPPKDMKALQFEEEAAPKVARKPKHIVLCQFLAPEQGEFA